MCEWNLDAVVRIFQGLLTPVIGAIAVYIAWQQFQGNRAKLRLETYDRRLKVYQELKDLLGAIVTKADASGDDLGKFVRGTAEADFLFEQDVPKYLGEVRVHAIKLRQANSAYRDFTQEHPPGYDHEKVVNDKHAALAWLIEQGEVAKSKFRPYLLIGR